MPSTCGLSKSWLPPGPGSWRSGLSSAQLTEPVAGVTSRTSPTAAAAARFRKRVILTPSSPSCPAPAAGKGCCELECGPASVDKQRMAGDQAAGVGRQEDGRTDQLPRLAEAV